MADPLNRLIDKTFNVIDELEAAQLEIITLREVLRSMGAADWSVGLRKRARAELKASMERLK